MTIPKKTQIPNKIYLPGKIVTVIQDTTGEKMKDIYEYDVRAACNIWRNKLYIRIDLDKKTIKNAILHELGHFYQDIFEIGEVKEDVQSECFSKNYALFNVYLIEHNKQLMKYLMEDK